MIKVLRILNRFNVGGPTYNVAYLTKYLSDDFETKLIGGAKEYSEASSEYILQKMNVPYTIVPQMRRSINPFQDILALWQIIKIIRAYKPDIVHTHAAKAGTLGRMAAIICRVPIIVHTFHGHVFHSYFNSYKTYVFKVIERFFARKTTAIIAISETQKHELGTMYKICKPEKIHIVPLGFDLQKFTENMDKKRETFRLHYKFSNNTIVIGIVGRLAPVKNHELFIDAIKLCMQKSNKHIQACIIGDGELREHLENYCTKIGIAYSTQNDENHTAPIIFTSWIQDIDYAYAGLDIVCLTSKNEGTPVSLIEAQASGVPVVSTNVGGVQNIVIDGKTALLSENTQDDFSQKLLQLIENKELRKTMSTAAKNNSVEKFHYTRLCKDIETVYKRYIP